MYKTREGNDSESPALRFFSKALVGEHSVLSRGRRLDSPAAQTTLIAFTTFSSYKYIRTCALTSISLSLSSLHLLFPLLLLPRWP
jgi:hypothetical protein